MNREPTVELEYDADRPIDGVMTALLFELQRILAFDHLRISQKLLAQVYLTVFRRQAKRLFHVKFLRRGGKWVVRMGGGDPAEVLAAIRVCRDHFDAWFAAPAHHAESDTNGRPSE